MRKNNKSIGSRALGNRTIIGIICIVAALAICFGIAPMVNKLRDGKAMVVRVSTAIEKGAMITDANIEVVEVGSFNLPGNVVKSKDAVIGKFAVVKRVKETFDLRPAAIIEAFDLKNPIYKKTSAYGHFNSPNFPWEQTRGADAWLKCIEEKSKR